MTNYARGIGVAGLVALLGLAMLGCELPAPNSTTGDATGSWAYSNTAGAQANWSLSQGSNGSISGTGSDGSRIEGDLSGESIALALAYSNNVTVGLTGTLSGTTMSGTFTNSTSGSGSWTAGKTN